MPNYLRAFRPGGTFFLTLVTEGRWPIFANDTARQLLHFALDNCRKHHAFLLDALVCLPDHLHMLMTLPDNDADFSTRIRNIKSTFTGAYLKSGGHEQTRSRSRLRQRMRGVWLKRFWEHTIRDDDDLRRHLDYIHYNPVKHGLVECPHQWPHSSFHRLVKQALYDVDWCCCCGQSRWASTPTLQKAPRCTTMFARHEWDTVADHAGE